jgi:ribonuclease HIII
MSEKGISPQDILSDNENFAVFNGVKVRKGTVAALFANIKEYSKTDATEDSKRLALEKIIELAPAVRAIGLHEHIIFKNELINNIIANTKA